ncbi:MAG: amino acid-binding protein [Desulfococcus sp.]|nr:MAG: amino acid-binding protein [Desulfococcus sp.]
MEKKYVVSVLGEDQPGIIAAVTRAIRDNNANIENVSQTLLQTEFAGIFIISAPEAVSLKELSGALQKSVADLHLTVTVKPLKTGDAAAGGGKTSPFVVTTRGPDGKGLVAGIAGVMAAHRVNITNLQAVFEGGDNPDRNVMIYEVDLPERIDKKSLDRDLMDKAAELALDICIQHRDIFQAINRI